MAKNEFPLKRGAPTKRFLVLFGLNAKFAGGKSIVSEYDTHYLEIYRRNANVVIKELKKLRGCQDFQVRNARHSDSGIELSRRSRAIKHREDELEIFDLATTYWTLREVGADLSELGETTKQVREVKTDEPNFDGGNLKPVLKALDLKLKSQLEVWFDKPTGTWFFCVKKTKRMFWAAPQKRVTANQA